MENIISIEEFNALSEEEKDEYIAMMAEQFGPKLANLEYIDCYEMFTHTEPENWEDSDIEPDIPQIEWVDLGLPSGTLWASCNIGAKTPYEAGLYFAWGETVGYTSEQVGVERTFNWESYKYGTSDNITKYNDYDNKVELDDEDDAAYVIFGDGHYTPSSYQIQELINTGNTTISSASNINCISITSNINGNVLYLPVVGSATGNSISEYGQYSEILSRTINQNDVTKSVLLDFGIEGFFELGDNWNRFMGIQIRPVNKLIIIDVPE